MNEVNHSSLRSEIARASSVSDRKQDRKVESGNMLPVELKRQASAAVESTKTATPLAQSTMPAREKIEEAVAKMNEYTQSTQRDLRFNMDEALGRVVVNVIDRDSQEVIRQIPDETFLRMARKLKEDLATGSKDPLRLINVSA